MNNLIKIFNNYFDFKINLSAINDSYSANKPSEKIDPVFWGLTDNKMNFVINEHIIYNQIKNDLSIYYPTYH
jgi:hypothetical protein